MVLNLVLAHMRSPLVAYVWGVVGILGGAISMIYSMREGKRQRVESPMDGVIMWLWAAFVTTMLITIGRFSPCQTARL